MYFQKIQTMLLEQNYQTAPKCFTYVIIIIIFFFFFQAV